MKVLDLFRLDGQVALVTGAARGIGVELARGLAEAGADVAIADIDGEAAIASAVALAAETGRRVIGMQADVSSGEQTRQLIDDVVSRLGGLDICIANAGIAEPNLPVGDVDDYLDEHWHSVIAVNLTGVYHTDMAAARFMKRQGRGRIINIASVVGFVADAEWGTIGYTASKGGVLQLTRQFANMLAGHGVRVNGIAPGYVATGMSEAEVLETSNPAVQALQAEVLRSTPLRRYARPDELRGLAVFLASEASSYCTGFTYAIDGGYLSR